MTQVRSRPVLVLTLYFLAGCGVDTAVLTEPQGGRPVFARRGGQTLYGITFQQGIQSDQTHPFSTLAKSGDPFGGPVTGNPVYLSLPASTAGATSVCDADGSGLGTTSASWGAYGGIWKGGFSVSAKAGKYHVSYIATRENGSGYLNLVVNAPAVKSNGNLTLTFTNVRGLVAANSTPDGGPTDPQDRCLTFSITATP